MTAGRDKATKAYSPQGGPRIQRGHETGHCEAEERRPWQHHRYGYDADNRITKVETSGDHVNWYTDADYFYYPHGPLQRVELGWQKVQGVDYAYTLQGWLKGINSDRLVPESDMGLDGVDDPANANRYIGRDAFGFSLNYHGDGDYEAIDATRWDNTGHTRPFAPMGTTGTLASAHAALYNGNIAHTTNSLQPFGGWSGTGQSAQVLAQVYRYDQLNRLKQAQGVVGLANNSWDGVSDATAHRYKSEYWYDANGNIDTLARYDQNGNLYDGFSYKYKRDGEGRLLQNRLYQLNDLADEDDLYVNEGPNGAKDIKWTGNVPFDPEDEDINTAYNYSYDELGNLVRDGREGIAEIDWTVAGKVRRVTMSTGRMLHFAYGTGGTRTLKQMGDPSHPSLPTGYREHYVRDAQGNIMAIYRYTNSGGASTRLVERPVYGSSRLGSYARPQEVMGPGLVSNQYTALLQPAGQWYELSDHLGNVSTVVTGRLLPGNGAGSVYQAEVMSASGVEPFGGLLPGRNHNSNRAVLGFNGMRKDDEIYGFTGTSYDFGARMYDPRIGRWLSTDPLAGKSPSESPYLFVGGNPITFVDPDGKFKIKYDAEALKKAGVTQQQVARFETIIKNISNLVRDNQQALDAISNTTGFSVDQIMTDLSFDKGPTIEVTNYGPGARGGKDGIVFDVGIVKQLAGIDGADKAELSTQTLGAALTVLHEYGHYGDQVTNDGENTGQYTYGVGSGFSGATPGKQNWRVTGTGHRGTDIEVFGFGVQVGLNDDGKFEIGPGAEAIPSNVNIKGASIPSSLPDNAKGTNVLKTLDVQ